MQCGKNHSGFIFPDMMYISTARELMKLIFAVSDVLLTMRLILCYKTEGFFTFIFAVFVAYLFHAIPNRYARSRRQKSICIPNFDEIS